jgi:N-acetylneuraminic acid mutarotase
MKVDALKGQPLWGIRIVIAAFFSLAGAALPLQGQTQSAAEPLVTHNTWTSGAAMPTAVWFPAGAGVIKNQIYVVGGYNSSNAAIADNQIYDPATNAWTTGAPLPTATAQGAAAVVKNILYIFGGDAGNGTCSTQTNAVWAYNPKTNSWSSRAAMPTARCSEAAVVEDNVIYVIGGYNNSSGRLNTVEAYDPATDTWTEESPLMVGKSEPSVGLVGKTIVAADGYTDSGDTGDSEGYDAATNSWTAYKADPTPRNGACGGSIGSLLYVAGGYPGGGPGTPAYTLTESFKVSKDTWATLAPMPQASMAPGSAVYKKQLYCFGGTSSALGTALDNVQIYQP